jgi:DNA repair exonuclease SbcCD ATPase subunit
MTLTPEQIEAIRKEWAGVQGEAALKTFAVTHIPALLSALEAAERRAGEAEAKARDQLAEDKHTLADGIRTMRALLGNAEAERDTLRARVAELERALTLSELRAGNEAARHAAESRGYKVHPRIAALTKKDRPND